MVELEGSCNWTIKNLGRRAKNFFRNAPFAGMVGQSLASFVRCEDLLVLRKAWPTGALTGAPSHSRIHLMDFSADACHTQTAFQETHLDVRSIDKILSSDLMDWGSEGHTAAATRDPGLVPLNYMSMLAQVLSLHKGTDTVLLIASFETPARLPICSICEMECCFRTHQEYPLQVVHQAPR